MANKTLYGFRLDTLTLHHGNTRANQNFRTTEISRNKATFLDSLENLRPVLVDKSRIGELRYEASPDPSAGSSSDTLPAIRVLSMEFLANRIDFTVRIGRLGSHDVAIALDPADDASLSDKASTNLFYVSIYLPKAGNTAIVVSEVRSRTSAATQLLKLISVLSFEAAVAAKDDSHEQWWRLSPKPISDAERLKEVITQGQGAALQLTQRAGGKGRPRAKSNITLRRNGLPKGALKTVQAIVLGWAKIPLTDPSIKAPLGTPVEQIMSLIGINVDSADFDDGSVTYDDAQGRTQTIKPSNISEVFIYPVKEGTRPTGQEIRTVAEERLRRLQASLKIPLHI